jgi:hypothetical protein
MDGAMMDDADEVIPGLLDGRMILAAKLGDCLRQMNVPHPMSRTELGEMVAGVLNLRRILRDNEVTLRDLAGWMESWADYEIAFANAMKPLPPEEPEVGASPTAEASPG